VWALAVIAFQMLSGRLPFEGPVREVLAKIVGEDPSRCAIQPPASARRSTQCWAAP